MLHAQTEYHHDYYFINIIIIGVRLYLQVAGSTDEDVIANFTVLPTTFFDDSQDNILWCQSANNGNPIGGWYFPAGNQVPVIDPEDGPLHVLHLNGQIGLLRDASIRGLEGLYNCVIPDENNINQTVWVAVYRGAVTYNDPDSKLSNTLVSLIT